MIFLSETRDKFFFLGDSRILIYASPEQLRILQTSVDFLVDGTFKVVPEVFYQLYIIHAVYRGHVVPVIYALLRKKNAETYTELLDEIVKIAPNWSPATVMMDFEQASINAFKRKFPSVALSGCYFHLRQSIHRKLQVRRNSIIEFTRIISTYTFRAWVCKLNTRTTQILRMTSTR